jgi:nucleotide-binding universal stress UspA family protein
MLKSVLLYLESVEQASPVIGFGVALAREGGARVRGVTLVDTREMEAAQDCESAVFVSLAHSRQAFADCVREGARAELSKACLAAKLNFDVRRIAGDPLEILPVEARFHDLVIASSGAIDRRLPQSAGSSLSIGDMLELLQRGVQPLLLLPAETRAVKRVLLVYDGSEAAGRAIRTYFSLGVMRDAEHRLLAIGVTEAGARASLAEMAEYCAGHCAALETGCAVGKTRRVLVPYAGKWEADLIVLGVGRGPRIVRRLLGQASLDLVRTLNCGLFAQM